MEGSDGSYILTRYEKVNGKRTYAKFILSVYRGEDSQIVGCLESPDLVKDTLYGEVSPNASYVTLNIEDTADDDFILLVSRRKSIVYYYAQHRTTYQSDKNGCAQAEFFLSL